MKPRNTVAHLDPRRRILSLVVLLAVMSTTYVAGRLIVRFVPERITFIESIWSHQAEPPYRYRLFEPMLGEGIGLALESFGASPTVRHIVAYSGISFLAFLVMFYAFFMFLRMSFSFNAALLGIGLLQAVIPLSVTGIYMEGDFVTAAFYATGLLLMALRKDIYLPILIGIGTFNREQMIFLAVIHSLWLVSEGRINRGTVAILVSSVMVYTLVFVGIRLSIGLAPTHFTPSFHIAANTSWENIVTKILPLWLGEVAGFVILAIVAYQRSNRFLRLSFLSLIPYFILFFLNGLLWETAKFLPAFLILIPMALQVLVGEYPHRMANLATVTTNSA